MLLSFPPVDVLNDYCMVIVPSSFHLLSLSVCLSVSLITASICGVYLVVPIKKIYYTLQNCCSRRDSNASEISLLVESALECFDFLSAECDDDFDDVPDVSMKCRINHVVS